jgi:serine/threonine protein kinase
VRVQVAHRVASALRAAPETKYIDVVGWERKGVFRGDVKPGNILVAEGHQPLLADFSMTDVRRLLDLKVAPPVVIRATPVSMPITAAFGTPGFMAAEQENEGVVNAKTDIYGLGMTFSHLFRERESSNNEFVDRLGELSDLATAMTNRVPEARPRDMAEVVRLLARAGRAASVKLSPGREARP